MTILALDTSTLVSSVALVTQDKLFSELTLQIKKTHSEQLMPHIAQLMENSGIIPSELTAVAVSIGPGSFTGLRIGLATAKALAYAQNIPVIGVPTLDALAYALPVPGIHIAPLLDAQKNNVYYALYRWVDGVLDTVMPASVGNIRETLENLNTVVPPVFVLGEAAVQYQDIIKEYPNLVTALPQHIIPRASHIGLLASRMIANGITHNVMDLEPFYIRRSEAEVLWEKRQGECG